MKAWLADYKIKVSMAEIRETLRECQGDVEKCFEILLKKYQKPKIRVRASKPATEFEKELALKQEKATQAFNSLTSVQSQLDSFRITQLEAQLEMMQLKYEVLQMRFHALVKELEDKHE